MYIVGDGDALADSAAGPESALLFYLNEHDPPHVHVTIGRGKDYPHAKLLLDTLDIVSVRGFSKADIAKILEVAETYQDILLEAWEGCFGEEE